MGAVGGILLTAATAAAEDCFSVVPLQALMPVVTLIDGSGDVAEEQALWPIESFLSDNDILSFENSEVQTYIHLRRITR